jgi:hypothetical protein
VKEGFCGIDEFRDAWIRINGSWDPKMEVVVYDFELTDPPPKQSRLARVVLINSELISVE